MTRRRRRLLIPIIHLITRIYLHIVFAPIMFALHSHSVSIKVVSCSCHGRSSAISLLLRPLLPTKSSISSSYFPLSVGSFRVHAVYHVLSELSFLSYLYQYLLRYPGFSYYSSGPLDLVLFLHCLRGGFVAFCGNNASPYWG